MPWKGYSRIKDKLSGTRNQMIYQPNLKFGVICLYKMTTKVSCSSANSCAYCLTLLLDELTQTRA